MGALQLLHLPPRTR